MNSIGVLINVEVYSIPCPTVQWQLNGENISTDDALFTFDQPCAANELPPYRFQLRINYMTFVTSGNYSASFNNPKTGPQRLPNLYAIPGEKYCNTFIKSVALPN